LSDATTKHKGDECKPGEDFLNHRFGLYR
jgi:hypothetical protein